MVAVLIMNKVTSNRVGIQAQTQWGIDLHVKYSDWPYGGDTEGDDDVKSTDDITRLHICNYEPAKI